MPAKRNLVLYAAITAAIAGCSDSRPVAPLSGYAFIPRKGAPPATMPATPAPAATLPATQPTTQEYIPTPPEQPEMIPVMLAPGQYQTIGGVVSEVNGNPIYAGKVLRSLRGELSARAPEMNEQQFRRFATDQIRERVRHLQRDELVFAAADRFLPAEDRRLAQMLTMQYRTRRITESGGSVELARRKATADGEDFEEQVYDQYRKFMTEVYYRRKVFPRIQITADDLRAYYNKNLQVEFTEPAEVTFRLIKIDSKIRGSQQRAKEIAEEIRPRAAEDFASVARTINDDARLARSGGEELPLKRGSYRLEKVEAALWELPVGEVSPVIEDGGNYYLAKVEDRKMGNVLSFDNPAVQAKIREILWRRQYVQLTGDIEKNLLKNSMVRESAEMMQTVLDMAMQGYTVWAKRE